MLKVLQLSLIWIAAIWCEDFPDSIFNACLLATAVVINLEPPVLVAGSAIFTFRDHLVIHGGGMEPSVGKRSPAVSAPLKKSQCHLFP